MHTVLMTTDTGNAHICITSEMAVAVGKIASAHDGAITIYWDDNDPQNVWRVNVDEIPGTHEYVVDDESGTIDPTPASHTLTLTDSEWRWLRHTMDRIGSRYDDPQPRTIHSKMFDGA